MNILKISFQYSTYTAKETPFLSEIMRYNDLEQTNTLCLRENAVRIEIKTLVILRLLFANMSPEAIRTHGCSRISILFSVILNRVYCEFYPMFSTVLIRLTMYGFARS